MKPLLQIAILTSSLSLSVVANAAITFNDVPIGTIIDSDHYKAHGVIFSTDLGQYLYTVASTGINSGFGPSLTASGNGKITIKFVVPGTDYDGTTHTTALMILDNEPGGLYYTVTSSDIDGQEMIQIGNNHNYLAGDGYSQEPGTHSIEFVPAKPNTQFLNSVGFGKIESVPEVTTGLLIPLGFMLIHMKRKRV